MFMRHLKAALLCGTTAALLAITPASAQDRAEVIHWWTSGGESAALQEFVTKFEEGGGEWVDNAIAGGRNARTQAINRVVGGNPPTAMQFNTGRQFEEVIAAGLLNPLDEVAERGAWAEHIPQAFVDAITFDGTVYAVPVNIHGQSWLWYNTAVLEQAGVEPPQTWDDVLAIAPKLAEAGVIPIVQGADTTQLNTFFSSVLLGVGGPELFRGVYEEANPDVLDTPEFRRAAEIMAELRQYRDQGITGRTWNLATAMVINGDAAMQVMGDWAKGEFINAGLTAGEDYGCVVLGENPTLAAGGDVFVFAKTDDEAQKATQVKLAEIMIDPATQVAFSAKKGSFPVRTDADVSSLDECAQRGMELVRSGNNVPSMDMLGSADLVGAVFDTVNSFMSDTSMDVDAFVEEMKNTLESAG
jgi:glucose/mannose transport system substrate-binding protein